MTHSFFPLVNWGMGTTLIIIFAVVCIVLAAIVIGFVMTGKSKEEIEKQNEEDSSTQL